MVLPIGEKLNFLPPERGKKLQGRKDSGSGFGELLAERVEGLDEDSRPGGGEQEQPRREQHDEHGGSGRETADSQGGEDTGAAPRGGRIDLRA